MVIASCLVGRDAMQDLHDVLVGYSHLPHCSWKVVCAESDDHAVAALRIHAVRSAGANSYPVAAYGVARRPGQFECHRYTSMIPAREWQRVPGARR